MADKKVSELDAITGADTAADDLFLIVDSSGSVTKKISRAELNNAIEQDVLATVDINGGTIDGTAIGGTTPSTGDFTTLTTTGNATIGGDLTINGTTTTVNSTTLDIDDINITVASGAANAAAADGAGLTVDGASATFNYASTGDKWTMNKPLDVTGDIIVSGNVDGRDVAADGTKLDGIEAGADVTDATSVQTAGALMDSELTNEAAVKALDQSVATTDGPSFVDATFTGTGAVKMPAGTTAQRPTAAQGQIRFNTTDTTFEGYDGSAWGAIGGDSGETSLILYEYTATSGQTTFSGADDNAATLSYTADNIQVVMNGIVLDPSDYTATNGTSVVLATGAAAGSLINIYAFKSFTVADTVSASAGGTFSANVAITGDLTVDTNTLYVDAANNRVGIGTSNPSFPLTIENSANHLYLKQSNQDNGWLINTADADGQLHFSRRGEGASPSNNEVLTISTGGAVGIGTNSPGYPMELASSSGAGTQFGITYVPNSVTLLLRAGGADANIGTVGSHPLLLKTSNTERVRITNGGINSQTIYNNTTVSGANLFISGGYNFQRSTSSSRYKTEITDATHGLDEVMNLRPVTYKGINDGDRVFGGLIAEEVHDAGLTEFVDYSEDEDGNERPEGLHYGHMAALAFKAIQELKTELDAEKAKVADLTTRIEALENAS